MYLVIFQLILCTFKTVQRNCSKKAFFDKLGKFHFSKYYSSIFYTFQNLKRTELFFIRLRTLKPHLYLKVLSAEVNSKFEIRFNIPNSIVSK